MRSSLTSLLIGTALLGAAGAAGAQPPPAMTPGARVTKLDDFTQAVGGPTLVSIDLEKVPLSKVLAELSRQAKITLTLDKTVDDKLVSSHFPAPTPFWQVLRPLLNDGGLGFDPAAGGYNIVKAASNEWWRPKLYGTAVQRGPFTVSVSSVSRTRQRSIRANAPAEPNATSASIEVQLLVDPKIHQIGRGIQVKLDSAQDDTGYLFINPNDEAPAAGFSQRGGSGSGNFASGIDNLTPQSHTLTSVKGTFLVPVWTGTQHFDIGSLGPTTRAEQREGRWTISFNGVKRTGDVCDVALLLSHDPMENDFSDVLSTDRNEMNALTQSLLGEAKLLDAAGHELHRDDVMIDSHRDPADGRVTSSISVDLIFALPASSAGPGQFVWEVPHEVENVLVPFEFDNLPLP